MIIGDFHFAGVRRFGGSVFHKKSRASPHDFLWKSGCLEVENE